MDSEENRTQILQILNIDLKQTLRSMRMHELGKSGKYFEVNQSDPEQDELKENGRLNVLRGYKFTLAPLHKGIFLQVDICSRVLQSQNLL